jgi:hypothetical protein
MTRAAAALLLEIAVVILVALALGTVAQRLLGSEDFAAAAGESARLLFFFMDVGLIVWVVILVVLLVRRRQLPAPGVTLLAAVIGVAANALTVLVVGFVQGGWAPLFVLFAIEAGIVFLIAAFVVAPVIHRLSRRPVKP